MAILVDECMTLCSRYLHGMVVNEIMEIRMTMMGAYLSLIILAVDLVPKEFILI